MARSDNSLSVFCYLCELALSPSITQTLRRKEKFMFKAPKVVTFGVEKLFLAIVHDKNFNRCPKICQSLCQKEKPLQGKQACEQMLQHVTTISVASSNILFLEVTCVQSCE